MKRHIQQPGVRQWAGEDLIELQAEPLKAIDGFFSAYGPCIIQGCQITDNGNGTYNISSGLLALSGTDVDGNNTFKVIPFSGVSNVPLPVYFTLAYSVVERSYLDGQVKPIAYNYRAEVSTVEPTDEYLELSEDSIIRFEDVIQCDAAHRFFTDEERKKLSGIDIGANKYVHPSTHPASMITEDSTHKFMTQSEKTVLSTLGTNFAKADLSNAMTVSLGRNGYAKFNNGLLLQWGAKENSVAGSVIIYLPTAFYDSNYIAIPSALGSASELGALTAQGYNHTKTFFYVQRKWTGNATTADTYFSLIWLAIGRWK